MALNPDPVAGRILYFKQGELVLNLQLCSPLLSAGHFQNHLSKNHNPFASHSIMVYISPTLIVLALSVASALATPMYVRLCNNQLLSDKLTIIFHSPDQEVTHERFV